MGKTEEVFSHPSALSNELDWSSPVPDLDFNTCFIPLTQGKFAAIDLEDFDKVSRHKWCAVKDKLTFYAMTHIRVDGRPTGLKMHRLILGLTDPKVYPDHRDGNGLNNRKSNLRICTGSQNQANKAKPHKSTSRFKGVHWNKECSKWKSEIRANGKKRYLGLFLDEAEAAEVYDTAALEIYGEFARLNFPIRAEVEK